MTHERDDLGHTVCMLIALMTSLIVLALAAGCAHRLWFSSRIWQAVVFLPPMLGAWAASLALRTPTDMSALMTFITGDIALYGLGILGVMRMLGGLPVGGGGGGGAPGDDDPFEEPPIEPQPAGPTHALPRSDRGPHPRRPRPPRRLVRRDQPDRVAPRENRARATWWSGRSD